MVVKIRLARFGRRHAPFYNIVVCQARFVFNIFLRLARPPLNSFEHCWSASIELHEIANHLKYSVCLPARFRYSQWRRNAWAREYGPHGDLDKKRMDGNITLQRLTVLNHRNVRSNPQTRSRRRRQTVERYQARFGARQILVGCWCTT